MVSTMNDKRLLPRQRKRLRVALGKTAVFSADVSPGGVCVELLHTLEVGKPVSGLISLAAHDFPFTGTVVWSEPGDEKMSQRGRIGIRFTGIENRFFDTYARTFGGRRPRPLAPVPMPVTEIPEIP